MQYIVEKRKPLSPTARRAGWVGCNILISKIPKQGIIEIVKNGKVCDINDVIKYIDTKKKDACDFINKCMLIMSDDEKLEKASINQIASAMGIVIEKFTKNLSKDDGVFLDEIIRAVQKIE